MTIVRTPVGLASMAPSAEFFQQLRTRAHAALACARLTEAQAWDLCELVDCIDAGDLAASPQERHECISALNRFLDSASPKLFRKFHRSSSCARGCDGPGSDKTSHVRAFA